MKKLTLRICETVACPFPKNRATFVWDSPSYFIFCFKELTIDNVSRSSPASGGVNGESVRNFGSILGKFWVNFMSILAACEINSKMSLLSTQSG